MEQIFFLVLVAVVGLIRWLLQVAETKKNEEAAKRTTPPSNAPVPRAPAQSEEERIRKFMEALGVPTTTAPPPKVQPRQVVPRIPRQEKRKVRPIDPFPRPQTSSWKPAPAEVAEPAPVVVVTAPEPIPEIIPPRQSIARSETSGLRAAPEFEVHVLGADAPEPPTGAQVALTSGSTTIEISQASGGWAARLAKNESLREAIILREIFGPPRSLQPIG